MELTTSVLLFLVFNGFTSGNEFLINRNRPLGSFQWGNGWDSFQIPISTCNRTIGGECKPYDASSLSGKSCYCYCPFNRASFISVDKKWTCLDNGKVRDLQDCSNINIFWWEHFNPRGQLYALRGSDRLPTNIPYGGSSGWTHCDVYLNSSWYLGCNGRQFRSKRYLRKMKELFVLKNRNFFVDRRTFDLQVNSGVQDASLLQGRIINLGIKCNSTNGRQYHSCLMFKLMGKLRCPIPIPDLQTSPAVDKATTTRKDTPTPRRTTTTTFNSKSATILTSMPFITSSITSAFPSNVPPRPSSGRERRTEDGSSSLGLIAGITASITLLIVVIVGFLVYRRRHSKRQPDAVAASCKETNSKDNVMMNPVTISTVQSGDENEYKALSIRAKEPEIYASNYSVPHHPHAIEGDPDSGHVYAPLSIPDGHNIYGHNAHEPVYNVLEQSTPQAQNSLQNGSTSFEQPVYNVLEELSATEQPEGTVNHGTEPVYNVLEESNQDNAENPGYYGAVSRRGPIYNTLEEPYADRPNETGTNEPVYNVLEENTNPSF